MTPLINETASSGLLRLLQLCSANFPVGAYAFSQGLEWAAEARWVHDVPTLNAWIDDQLQSGMRYLDVPILLRFIEALRRTEPSHAAVLDHWNNLLLANRETHELRVAELAMGEAASRVARELSLNIPERQTPNSFLLLFAYFVQHWQIQTDAAVQGYLWTWLENQVAAAVKLIPLGQGQAQRVLDHHTAQLAETLAEAKQISDADIGASLPGVAIASALHETQYTRLFRS